MSIRVALFGLHSLLSDTLIILEKQNIFPELVVFPPGDSKFHALAEAICIRNNINFLRPHSVKVDEFIEQVKLTQINRIVVNGYNEIFPDKLLALATLGAINCHGGLLPEERGPVPHKWAVYNNRIKTGVTIHEMTSKIDQGKIYFQKVVVLKNYETAQSLLKRLSSIAANRIPWFFTELNIHEKANNQHISTTVYPYLGQIPPELTTFDLNLTADELDRRVRAFSPRPGVFFQRGNSKLLIKKIETNLKLVTVGSLIFRALDKSIAVTEFEVILTIIGFII